VCSRKGTGREGEERGGKGVRAMARWRVKGSEARRGVQGRKRDHGIISTNRTIHELSVTVYVHSTGVIVQSATERIPYPNRTPERPQPRCSYHSPGRGWRGNWHGHGPTPAFAPVQSAGVHVASCSPLSFASAPLSPSCASEDAGPFLVCPLALASSRSRRGA